MDGKTHYSQAGFMKTTAKRFSRVQLGNFEPWEWTQFSECFNDKPSNDYFTINAKAFNSDVTNFAICNDTVYRAYDIG